MAKSTGRDAGMLLLATPGPVIFTFSGSAVGRTFMLYGLDKIRYLRFVSEIISQNYIPFRDIFSVVLDVGFQV
jgi:hypothetical protein